MNSTNYFTLADGYAPGASPQNSGSTVTSANTLLFNYNVSSALDGYNVITNAVDLRNVQQIGVVASFLTGSTIAGSLVLQVSDDKEDQTNSGQPIAGANWVNVTAPNNTNVTISSGASNVAYDYPLIGHRWARLNLSVTSGSGNITFAYNLRSA